jgi:hypothetical protein
MFLMNTRVFSLALMLSLPLIARADVTLEKGDFTRATKISKDGETVVSAKLSKSGKSKLRKLNAASVGRNVHAEIGGVTSDFRLREPIKGDGIEMGPYPAADAAKVINSINDK